MELTISINENHKSLSALESIDKNLLLAVSSNYLSAIGKSESELKFQNFVYITRLDKIFTSIFNQIDKITSKKIKEIAILFNNIDIKDILNNINSIKAKLKSIPDFISKDDIRKSSTFFLDYYFSNKEFIFNDISMDYIRDIILNCNLETEKKLSSDLYWIYNKIHINDTVRKVTKKGETLGTVVENDNNLFVKTNDGIFPLTSAWNKLTTHVNFSDVAFDISCISSRLYFVSRMLEKGPTKGDFIKLSINNISFPVLLTYKPIKNIDIRQIVFSNKIYYSIINNIISFYNLSIDYHIDFFTTEDDLIDCYIVYYLLKKLNMTDGA